MKGEPKEACCETWKYFGFNIIAFLFVFYFCNII